MSGTQVGEMNIVLSLNAATYSQAIDQAYKKLDQLAGKSKQIGHSTVSSVQAASGALRELNGDFTNNIRAVERFITTIPGVGDALKMAFPLVGGLAFGAMLVDSGQKVYEFTKQLSKIPENIRTGFGELNQSTRQAGVELDVVNDKLVLAIAKLEHKPVNALKLALDEDRLAASQLGAEIDKADRSIRGLLEKNSVGLLKGFTSFFTGENYSETGGAEKNITAIMKKLQGAQLSAQDAEDAASPSDGPSVKLSNRAKLQNALTEAIRKTSDALAKEQMAADQDKFANHAPIIEMYSGTLRQLQGQQHNFQAGNERSDLTTQEAELQQRKELATAAREAQRKAQQAQMEGFESGLASMKIGHQVSIVEENDYWLRLLAPAQKYPENLRKVMEHLASARQAIGRELDELIKKYEEAAKKRLEVQKRTDETAMRLSDEMDRQQHRSADFTSELNAVRTENADALAAMVTAHDVATGAISRHDAAVQSATLHASTYAAQLKRLRDDQKHDDEDGSLTSEQREANKQGREVQVAKVQGDADRTALEDRWNVFSTTGLGGATSALKEFVAASKDSSQQMKNLTASMLASFNDTLLKQITGQGQRGDWSHLGQSVFSNIAGASLNKGEGMLLSGLGLGKADGSSESTALWTRIAGGAKSVEHSVGGFLGKIFGKSKGGDSDDSDSSDSDSGGGGGEGGGFGSILSNIVPFFADGGDFKANSMAVVGEKGPELVRFGRSGTVIPNNKAFGGGEVHHHTHNWDLRGAGDPAQVRAVVQHEFNRNAPSLIAASVRATHEYHRRPSFEHEMTRRKGKTMITKSSAAINAGKLDTLIRAHKPHPRLNEVLNAVRRHNDRFAADASTLDMIRRLRPHPDAEAINAVIRRATVRNRVFVTTLREIETARAT